GPRRARRTRAPEARRRSRRHRAVAARRRTEPARAKERAPSWGRRGWKRGSAARRRARAARGERRGAAPLTIDAIDDECNEALLLCTSARSLRRPLAASNREQSGVTVVDEPGGAKR